ncbi:HD-GYP domain-containing protein [Candidatus Latescibacterota bacterium]
MRLCAVKDVDEGMVLGKSLYEINGKLLLGAGFRINDQMKIKLIARKYTHVYIMEEGTDDIVPEDVISDEIKMQAKLELASGVSEVQKQATFQKVSSTKAKELIKNGYLKNVNITMSMSNVVDDILKDISSAGANFAKMVMIKSEESYFFDHACNTAVLAILIGKQYRFSKSELKSLALGTFLHDIGKKVTEQMKDSETPGKSSNLYNEHPTFGYLLLDNSGGKITPMETQVVNQHHELQDGSGFPIGLKGTNQPPVKTMNTDSKGRIYRLAEICCVVNAFDNMVYNPTKSKQLSQGQALKQMILDSGRLYNKNIVQALLKVVPYYPVGISVKVINIIDPLLIGYMGVVAKINEQNINRPVIVLIKDKFQKKIKPLVIDTSKLKHIELEVMI